MRICSKNPNHRRLGPTRCEMPGCGGRVIEVPDQSILIEPATGNEPEKLDEQRNRGTGSDPGQRGPSVEHSRNNERGSSLPTTREQKITPVQRLQPGEQPNLGVDWPWGFEPLPEYLAIGRDASFSPLATQLRAYRDVSRKHAEIRREGTSFLLRDLGSAQGTFLNEQRIAPRQDVVLHDGGILRFARHLTGTARLAR
jgi:FHA domain